MPYGTRTLVVGSLARAGCHATIVQEVDRSGGRSQSSEGERNHAGATHPDHALMDRAADGDVRRLLAAAAAQPRRSAHAVPGGAVPRRPRPCRRAAADVAAVLYLPEPDQPCRRAEAPGSGGA